MLTEREAVDSTSAAAEDDSDYPIPLAGGGNQIHMAKTDGDVRVLPIKSLHFGTNFWMGLPGGKNEVLALHNIKASLYITDARVAVVYSDFKMERRFVGSGLGLFAAGAGNVIARAAARRRSETALVGQLRYVNLIGIHAAEKKGLLRFRHLGFWTGPDHCGDLIGLVVSLENDKTISYAEIGEDVATRARLFRSSVESTDRPEGIEVEDPNDVAWVL